MDRRSSVGHTPSLPRSFAQLSDQPLVTWSVVDASRSRVTTPERIPSQRKRSKIELDLNQTYTRLVSKHIESVNVVVGHAPLVGVPVDATHRRNRTLENACRSRCRSTARFQTLSSRGGTR